MELIINDSVLITIGMLLLVNHSLSNMSVVLNNNDHSNVADYIKIIIYYDILNNDATVWDFTDEDYLHSSKSGVQKVISL